MEITFKEHLVEKDEIFVSRTNYHLEILYNNDLTKIIVEAQVGPGIIEANIGFRPTHWSSYDEYRREMRVELEADDIEDLKRWIIDNIDEVFEFCFAEVVTLKSHVCEHYDMLKRHLTEREDIEAPIEVCPCCKGRGYHKKLESEIPCKRCKGTGRVRRMAA